MSHEYIVAEQRGRVGIITFNRPDRLNAMIPEMGIEVREQLEAWETDDSVGAIVLTGRVGRSARGRIYRISSASSRHPTAIQAGNPTSGI